MRQCGRPSPPPRLAGPTSSEVEGGSLGHNVPGRQLPWKPAGTRLDRWARAIGPLAEVGRLEDREIRALFLAAIEHAQQPAVALGGVLGPRHEDRLAEAVVLAGAPRRALAGLEVVVDQPVLARLAGLRIGDVAARRSSRGGSRSCRSARRSAGTRPSGRRAAPPGRCCRGRRSRTSSGSAWRTAAASSRASRRAAGTAAPRRTS